MPTLHALFVAIDAYPNPKHVLEGCVADMQQFHLYLDTHCTKMGLAFRPLVLANEEATRDAIIAAFQHFQAAETDDQCLFFYAGHGARCESPEMFWALEPDQKTESIVCYDSRQPGGRDLMDKELSYLIWTAMQGKSMPLITVTDCCHSGRLREIIEAEPLRIRQIREVGAATPAESYLGFEHYKKGEDGQVSPPQARRVHLGAARDVETAKEVNVGGASRGIFTYCLVQALEAAGPLVSYTNLMNRVQMRVRANIADQSPQLETTFAADKNLRFLSNAVSAGPVTYLATYDRNLGWIVNAGAIHGLSVGDPANLTLLELVADHTPITIMEVMPDRSRIAGLDDRDKSKVYLVVVARHAVPKFEIILTPDSDPAAIMALQQGIGQYPSDFFRLGTHSEPADFLVRAKDNVLSLHKLQDDRPLFQRVPGYDAAAIKIFLARLEVVANWRQILELTNTQSAIKNEEITTMLFCVTEPGNYENNARVALANGQEVADFYYTFENAQWHKPAFQLKVTNTGQRPLWVSLLYLGHDFSITNQLLPKQMLAPGEEVWAQEIVGAEIFRTISLHIEDAFLAQGIQSIEEYFKLLICTEELNTDAFNQQGLAPDTGAASPLRSLDLRSRIRPEKRDWQAREIVVRIVRDMDLPEASKIGSRP